MKKIVRDQGDYNNLDASTFTGAIDEITARLQALQARGIVHIESEHYGYDGGVEYYACRQETDEEEAEREAKELKMRQWEEEQQREKVRKREERERKDFERLKKKFEQQ